MERMNQTGVRMVEISYFKAIVINTKKNKNKAKMAGSIGSNSRVLVQGPEFKTPVLPINK
jgi:hypothetical protein